MAVGAVWRDMAEASRNDGGAVRARYVAILVDRAGYEALIDAPLGETFAQLQAKAMVHFTADIVLPDREEGELFCKPRPRCLAARILFLLGSHPGWARAARLMRLLGADGVLKGPIDSRAIDAIAAVRLSAVAPPGSPSHSGASERRLRQGARSLRVLVVEDELLVSWDLREIIEGFGGEVVGQVDSGADALGAACETLPDVILMDICIAGDVDGIAAADAIRMLLGTPVVFITGHCDQSIMRRIGEFGRAELLLKPAAPVALRDAVLKACGLLDAD